MKETSKQILEELILGERDWDAVEVIQAMEDDPEFASAVGATRKTLAALETHAGQLDDLPMGSIQVSDSAPWHLAPTECCCRGVIVQLHAGESGHHREYPPLNTGRSW